MLPPPPPLLLPSLLRRAETLLDRLIIVVASYPGLITHLLVSIEHWNPADAES